MVRKILSTCDNCGKKINKKKISLDKYEKHFCDHECYREYKRKHKYYPSNVKKKDMSYQKKIKHFANLRVKINGTKGN